MSAPRPKPRFTKTTVIIYAIIALLTAVLCSLLGCAMDFSVGINGKLDYTKMEIGFKRATNNIPYILHHIADKDSNVCKMTFFGLLCMAVFILYKFAATPKRFHRRGQEHGSAKWGDEKEMNSLAEKEKKPEFKPVLRDGKRVFDNKGNFVGFTIDNNIIIADKLKLSLNTWQHNLNLNMFIIGDSGSGKVIDILQDTEQTAQRQKIAILANYIADNYPFILINLSVRQNDLLFNIKDECLLFFDSNNHTRASINNIYGNAERFFDEARKQGNIAGYVFLSKRMMEKQEIPELGNMNPPIVN